MKIMRVSREMREKARRTMLYAELGRDCRQQLADAPNQIAVAQGWVDGDKISCFARWTGDQDLTVHLIDDGLRGQAVVDTTINGIRYRIEE